MARSETKVMLDAALLARALALTGLSSPDAVLEQALETLVRLKEQAKVRELFGELHWDDDLGELREGPLRA